MSASLCFDLKGFYERKKRNSIMVTVSLLVISVLILIIGVAATTRTQNVTVGGYYPGVIVSSPSHFTVAPLPSQAVLK